VTVTSFDPATGTATVSISSGSLLSPAALAVNASFVRATFCPQGPSLSFFNATLLLQSRNMSVVSIAPTTSSSFTFVALASSPAIVSAALLQLEHDNASCSSLPGE
jgi:hypothetical protein